MNYQSFEVKAARSSLYRAIEAEQHLLGATASTGGRVSDRRMLAYIMETMGGDTIRFLRANAWCDWSFTWMEIEGLDIITRDYAGGEHEFIDPELEGLRIAFIADAEVLRSLIPRNTSKVPGQDGYHAVRGIWEREEQSVVDVRVQILESATNKVCNSYDALIRAGRRKLDP